MIFTFEQSGTSFDGTLSGDELVECATVALQGVLERGELAPGHGDGFFGLPELGPIPTRRQMSVEFGGYGSLGRHQSVLFRCEIGGFLTSTLQLFGQPGPFGLQGGDHVGIGRRVQGLGQRSPAFTEHTGETSGPLHHAFGTAECGRQVGLTFGRQFISRPLRVGIEGSQGGLQPDLFGSLLFLQPETFGPLRIERSELGAGHMEAEGTKLIGQPGEGLGGCCLALEGPNLALDLTDQVEQALQVLIRRGQPALRALAAPTEFQDTGRLFDD